MKKRNTEPKILEETAEVVESTKDEKVLEDHINLDNLNLEFQNDDFTEAVVIIDDSGQLVELSVNAPEHALVSFVDYGDVNTLVEEGYFIYVVHLNGAVEKFGDPSSDNSRIILVTQNSSTPSQSQIDFLNSFN